MQKHATTYMYITSTQIEKEKKLKNNGGHGDISILGSEQEWQSTGELKDLPLFFSLTVARPPLREKSAWVLLQFQMFDHVPQMFLGPSLYLCVVGCQPQSSESVSVPPSLFQGSPERKRERTSP